MPLLEADKLTKNYGGGKPAVNELSMKIPEGRCTALLGPNGAGKTTTLRMLAGLLAPTSGSIAFKAREGVDIRESVGYLPQYPAFPNWMSGKEFLTYAGRLAYQSKRVAAERARELLERVGLAEAAGRRIGGYSGGMKQRLGIAQAIVHRPQLLMLDEPVSALDPIGRREVMSLLAELKKETTILFSTHVLHDAEAVCDDVIIIREGRLALAGELRAVMRAHSRPVITLQLAEGHEAWLLQLAGRPYVRHIDVKPNEARIAVDDLEAARTALLREIVEADVPVVRLEAGSATLEDLFMEAVRS
ncbi:ABC transporter ATP-binding protein [Cohnella ginsengisoli]|uniref:ABC transporter ATP-binding protein n=1 Tax=Cohnella ginsengisoli TaxID=425004 RepID=A0A9X4KL32_9BACL|nr:ABC transporter ATP-binding protein [Cohnella ginsengisoli]MDG0794038.1 ABC transporter ATP-binding protein [Cohnella ginsengisoli]